MPAILLAAGAGRRVGADRPKALLDVAGRPMLSIAAAAAVASSVVSALVVTAPDGWQDPVRAALDALDVPIDVVTGGGTRHESVRIALAAVGGAEVVVVHDAARPFAAPHLFVDVVRPVADGAAAAIPVVPIADTVKRVRDGVVVRTEPRDELTLAQTPQAFRRADLTAAHERAAAAAVTLTDDAAVMEWAGYEVRVVPGDADNVKITTLLDLVRAGERMGSLGD